MDSIISFTLVLVLAFLFFLISIKVGVSQGVTKTRKEAIEHGFASYVINPTNAFVTFQWRVE